MNKAELQQKAAELGPWHYCFDLGQGVTTGTSKPDQLPYKIPGMIQGGAFQKTPYINVLDAGANSGYISMWAVDKLGAKHVDAIEGGDKFYTQLEFMVNHRNYTEIHPMYNDLRTVILPENFYELIIFLGTAHHVGLENLPALFAKFHRAMRHDAEIVVQTKTDLPIESLLLNAGFVEVKVVHQLPNENRTAWVAYADKMKVSLVEDITCAPQRKTEPKLTNEEQILKALGFLNNDAMFKLLVLKALGELILANHWLRGTFYWLAHTKTLTFKNEQDERNFYRLYKLGEEYEARAWEVAPPRAVLTLLQEWLNTGEMADDLLWVIENLVYDEHGRVGAGNVEENLEDLADLIRSIAEAREKNSKLIPT